MYNLNQFNENITNLYSEFVHKNNSKCHNGGDSNCSFREGLLKIIQVITQQPFSFYCRKRRTFTISPALEAHFLPYLNKEEMSRQEKLTALLKHLATTPNGDKYMQFVLQLAEESVTAETLQNLIRSGNVAPSSYNEDGDTTENSPCIIDESAESNIIIFTKNEVKRMDKTFKKHFILNGYIAHVIKRKSGKNGFYYEIRYRRNGYNKEILVYDDEIVIKYNTPTTISPDESQGFSFYHKTLKFSHKVPQRRDIKKFEIKVEIRI